MEDKNKLSSFLNYRKKFEMSQQVRIQSKMQDKKNGKLDEDDKE